MRAITKFIEIEVDIEVQESRIKSLKKEIEILKRSQHSFQGLTGIDYSKDPGGTPIQIPLDRALDRIDRLLSKLEQEQEILEIQKEARREIHKKLDKLKGIDHSVVYHRDIRGMKLEDIAEKLGYSEAHIKRVSSRNPRIL